VTNSSISIGRRNPDFVRTPEQRTADLKEIPAATDEQLAAAIPLREWKKQRKQLITLRLDPEVLDFFKQSGEGYQSRINEALRRVVAAESK
jgi:uncharacterized protein (DUF4415 family)